MVKSGNWCKNNCSLMWFLIFQYLAWPISYYAALFGNWNLGNQWNLGLLTMFAAPDSNYERAISHRSWLDY